MRFKEIITELFNSTAPYQWVESKINQAKAQFEVGNVTYRVNFHYFRDQCWEFAFQSATKVQAPVGRGKTQPIVQHSYKLTKTGNEYLVFSTILKIVEAFLIEYHPNELNWSADKDEASRAPLYRAFVSRFKPKLNSMGYDIKETTKTPDASYADFVIVKHGYTGGTDYPA